MECFVSDHTERVLCSHEPDAGRGCATKLLWTRVQGGIIRSLQATTLAELVRFSGAPMSSSPVAASIASTTPVAATPSTPLTATPTTPLTATLDHTGGGRVHHAGGGRVHHAADGRRAE